MRQAIGCGPWTMPPRKPACAPRQYRHTNLYARNDNAVTQTCVSIAAGDMMRAMDNAATQTCMRATPMSALRQVIWTYDVFFRPSPIRWSTRSAAGTHTHTYTHTHTHTHAHARTHTHTFYRPSAGPPGPPPTHTYARRHTRTRTHAHARTRAHTHRLREASRDGAHPLVHPVRRQHTHTRTYTHTHKHTRTHAHARTHAHTHPFPRPLSSLEGGIKRRRPSNGAPGPPPAHTHTHTRPPPRPLSSLERGVQ